MTPKNLLAQNDKSLSRVKDVWEFDYKSTSDDEDNDSDEDEYGNVQYPKPR